MSSSAGANSTRSKMEPPDAVNFVAKVEIGNRAGCSENLYRTRAQLGWAAKEEGEEEEGRAGVGTMKGRDGRRGLRGEIRRR
ncbi:hypothetical protein Mapa_005764 [Marchantia paleacea]|nr:hypothetical protein Mapa_005764 [Marchantia paleacea]